MSACQETNVTPPPPAPAQGEECVYMGMTLVLSGNAGTRRATYTPAGALAVTSGTGTPPGQDSAPPPQATPALPTAPAPTPVA